MFLFFNLDWFITTIYILFLNFKISFCYQRIEFYLTTKIKIITISKKYLMIHWEKYMNADKCRIVIYDDKCNRNTVWFRGYFNSLWFPSLYLTNFDEHQDVVWRKTVKKEKKNCLKNKIECNWKIKYRININVLCTIFILNILQHNGKMFMGSVCLAFCALVFEKTLWITKRFMYVLLRYIFYWKLCM